MAEAAPQRERERERTQRNSSYSMYDVISVVREVPSVNLHKTSMPKSCVLKCDKDDVDNRFIL